jgi:DNA-directed RNA polymerase specialized sigma24 family protein
VQGVSQLQNEELLDLIRIAIGEARRRGIGLASAENGSGQRPASVEEPTHRIAVRVIRKAAPILDIPPAKASMVRAAVRAGFSATRVAKDFGVSVGMVRKLAAT